MTKPKPILRRTDRVYGVEAISRVEVDGDTVGYIAKNSPPNQRAGVRPEWVWFLTLPVGKKTAERNGHLYFIGTRSEATAYFIRRLKDST